MLRVVSTFVPNTEIPVNAFQFAFVILGAALVGLNAQTYRNGPVQQDPIIFSYTATDPQGTHSHTQMIYTQNRPPAPDWVTQQRSARNQDNGGLRVQTAPRIRDPQQPLKPVGYAALRSN